MKLTTLTCVALLLSGASALAAEAGSDTSTNNVTTSPSVPDPRAAENTAGRPSGILNDSQCEVMWKKASSHGSSSLDAQAARPFITNFQQADTDKNGQISDSEFKQGCKIGLVQNTSANPKEMSTKGNL